MMTNDDTIAREGKQFANKQDNRDNAQINGNEQDKKNDAWKKVVFGGSAGILIGAGTMYAATSFAANSEAADADNTAGQIDNVKVAKVSDNLSFKDAFDAARAQVSPGGVFLWNGGLYSTYNEDEWKSMSDEDKVAFTQAIRPEVRADEIVADRMSEAKPHVVVIKEQVAAKPHEVAESTTEDVQPVTHNAADSSVAMNAGTQQQSTGDDDVHVVGTGYVQGHQAVAFDMTGNGEADVAIIDMNDNGKLDDPDIAVFSDGTTATIGEISGTQGGESVDASFGYTSGNQEPMADPSLDPNMQQASYGNPDPSPDMPYYINDADISGTTV